MGWTVSYGKGRVSHTILEYDETSVCGADFLNLPGPGTEWAATSTVTLPVPKDFRMADHVSAMC